MYKILTSIDNLHIISITILGETAYFKIINFEFEYVKTFLLLFKECVEFLKNNNIKLVKQEILYSEFELFKYSKILNKTNYENIMIETKFENFTDEIYSVFNINLYI